MKSPRSLLGPAFALPFLIASASMLPAATRAMPDETRAQTGDPARRDSLSVSDLLGSSVKTAQDEKVGKVEDVRLDLESGRIVGVLLSSGGFLGIGDSLSMVDPSRFSLTADGELLIDMTKESLASAPRFERSSLGTRIKQGASDMADRVTDATGMNRRDRSADTTADSRGRTGAPVSLREPDRPHMDTNADNTARNRRDRDPALRVDPMDQGNRRSDIEITAKIRSGIVANDRLSTNAKNVKIVTRDGQVTLRGPVASEEERSLVNEIASQAAPGRVTDQLEVIRR